MSGGETGEPTVLVVEADGVRRRLLHERLTGAGARVLEVARPDDVAAVAAGLDSLHAAVVGGGPADALALMADLARRHPRARLVLLHEGSGPSLASTADVAGVLHALDLRAPSRGVDRVIDLVAAENGHLAEQWAELCRWDPLLPPESSPPLARDVIAVVTEALTRPQPLGYGPDSGIEQMGERFAASLNSLDEGIEQLVCLRETMRREIQERVPAAEALEALARMDMVVDRVIGVASRTAAARLEQEALLDPLTGLRNRRALQQDLARELSRATRRRQPLSVVAIDVIGLKAVNDGQGHAAGDRVLRALADALRRAVRGGDLAYRVGGDEFSLVLIETGAEGTAHAMDRVMAAGAPDVRWGAAVYPDEAPDADTLLARADERLLARPGGRG